MDSPNEFACSHGYFYNNNEYLLVNASGLFVSDSGTATHLPDGCEDYLFVYLTAGELIVNHMKMKAGQLIVFYPKTAIHITSNNKVSFHWVHFSGFGAQAVVDSCNFGNTAVVDVGISENAIKEFSYRIKESLQHEYCFKISAAARLTTVMVSLSRNTERNEKQPLKESKVAASIEYIKDNYCSDISLETLAEIEHLSISRYRTFFKEYMGTAPLDYIITLRIKKACELISESDLNIGEVAEAVGYSDQLYFSRIFKKRMGVIPSEYRNAETVKL